jgi:hypothetical protein
MTLRRRINKPGVLRKAWPSTHGRAAHGQATPQAISDGETWSLAEDVGERDRDEGRRGSNGVAQKQEVERDDEMRKIVSKGGTRKAEAPPEGMQFQRELITPEIAEAMLGGNIGNRSLAGRTVELLRSDYGSGRWLPDCPQPIVLNGERLIDGQHRLMAIIKSGTTQSFWVCRGAEQSMVDAIDRGRLALWRISFRLRTV